MPTSRLRLQLAGWFAAAVFVAVSVLDIGLILYLHNDAEARSTRQLREAASGVRAAVRREHEETGAAILDAAAEALNEWPPGPEAFSVSTVNGARRMRGSASLAAAIAHTAPGRAEGEMWTTRIGDEERALLTVLADTLSPPFRVVVARSTKDLDEYNEVLARWLALSIPGVTVFALIAGYLLARRALTPLGAMTHAIARIEPDDLTQRLPVRAPRDELDGLAAQFNQLLERLSRARERNRTFITQAAHQLKTPLTIVRGEAELGLEREREPQAYREILGRVRAAAERMAHRVDGLFLLAQADAGERPPLSDTIELDALALECADLMRGRAQHAQGALELARVEAAEVRGNEQLLREALLELVENALKHGAPGGTVRISAYCEGDRAQVAVSSRGNAVAPVLERSEGGGLGLSIVRWIAAVHGGELTYQAAAGINTFSVAWPATAAAGGP